MKIISLPANKYHKPGQVINTDEATAKHLIEKGYAKAEGDDDGKADDNKSGNSDDNQKSKPNNKKQK